MRCLQGRITNTAGFMGYAWAIIHSPGIREVDEGFRKMLDEIESEEKESKEIFIQPAKSQGLWLKIAAAFILIIAGFAAGYLVNRPTIAANYKQQEDSLSAQVHDMREIMMLSLLENPSASER